MLLSNKAIKELQRIYFKKFGTKISFDEVQN